MVAGNAEDGGTDAGGMVAGSAEAGGDRVQAPVEAGLIRRTQCDRSVGEYRHAG